MMSNNHDILESSPTTQGVAPNMRIVIFLVTLFLIPLLHSPTLHGAPKESEEPATKLKKHHFSAPHLGTIVHLVFYTEKKEHAAKLAKTCFQRVKDLDAIFSDYRPDSEVTKLCAKPIGQAHQVSPELFTVIAQAQSISEKSDGAFDITLGKHTRRLRQHASQKTAPKPDPSIQKDLATNYRHLTLNRCQKSVTFQKALKIDLGGIAKGYIADQLMLILKKAGITHAAVIIGGETVLADAPPGKTGWRIGIENPEQKVIGILELANTALSTSGDSYQFFETEGKRHSHLIDPSTKQSKSNRLNVTIIAPTAMQADAWATALRVLPTEKAITLAKKEAKLKALFIPHQKDIIKTDNFPAIKKLQNQNP